MFAKVITNIFVKHCNCTLLVSYNYVPIRVSAETKLLYGGHG